MGRLLTIDQIKAAALDPCGSQVSAFLNVFGDSVEINSENCSRYYKLFSEDALFWCFSFLLSQESREKIKKDLNNYEKEYVSLRTKKEKDFKKKKKIDHKYKIDSEEIIKEFPELTQTRDAFLLAGWLKFAEMYEAEGAK